MSVSTPDGESGPMRINLSLKYVIVISAVLLIVLGVVLGIISKRHEELVLAQIEMQAKALFQQVVITRRWVADHGGVFVEKLPWVKSNPYLADSTITDVRGRQYLKRNPAMVTKQLSWYAKREHLYFFHITSLKLLNQDNAPDKFEATALGDFETKKVKDAAIIEKMGDSYYYRYIAPLHVEKACLECHAAQGYKVGDIRGAISVSIPMDYAVAGISAERKHIVGGLLATGMVLVAVLYLVTRRLVIKPLRRIRGQMACFSHAGNPDIPLIKSGDEIEDLSRSFGEMARAIDAYHTRLQEKVRAATRELTEKNDSLVRASRSKSDFIAKTSHELRTPLTTIKGAMDYLSVKLSMRETNEDRDLLVFFEMIKKNADRLIRLVNGVLEYERIELGAVEMDFREVNLKESFQEVIAGIRPLAEEQGVGLRLHAMDVTAMADDDRLKQVLTNLLSNALHFSPKGSQISVTLTCRDEFVQASVEDRGSGVPEQDRNLIFQQFYTKDTSGGTGLGLAICKGIIEAHGGEIGVAEAEGGGSRFWFRIPKSGTGNGDHEKTAACDR